MMNVTSLQDYIEQRVGTLIGALKITTLHVDNQILSRPQDFIRGIKERLLRVVDKPSLLKAEILSIEREVEAYQSGLPKELGELMATFIRELKKRTGIDVERSEGERSRVIDFPKK